MTGQDKKNEAPARRVAYAGVVAALSLVLLYVLYALPAFRFTVLFALSLLPVVLAHEKRYVDSLLSFIVTATLSGLLFPARGTWLLYVAFFGWYGIAREFIISRLSRPLSWVVLAALFNAAFFSLYFFAGRIISNLGLAKWLEPFIIPAAEAAFVVFELIFGIFRGYYVSHLRKLLFR